MSQVKDFHLMHGIVLAKISRNERPTLRLVETDVSNVSLAYILNDAVFIYVRYSLSGRVTKKTGKAVWNFPFHPLELAKIRDLREKHPVHFSLVVGFQSMDAKQMEVCLLHPDEIDECIDVNSKKVQIITVEVRSGESLRAYGPKNSEEKHKLVISRNRLDEWKIPGS